MVCPCSLRSEKQNRKDENEKGEWINHKEKRIKSHLLKTLS